MMDAIYIYIIFVFVFLSPPLEQLLLFLLPSFVLDSPGGWGSLTQMRREALVGIWKMRRRLVIEGGYWEGPEI